MIYPKPSTKTEEKKLRRESYMQEKEDLTSFFYQQGYDRANLGAFLVNSLKTNYEDELIKDGLM